MKNYIRFGMFLILLTIKLSCTQKKHEWKPIADWGHWRLGHRSNLEFLEKNHFTVTFGQGAPNFESVTRAEFDKALRESKAFNDSYHDKGYIVLRYLSTSLNGESETPTSQPKKEQIDLLKFYNERWNDFADYIGEKPAEDPATWMMVHPDGSFPYYRYAPYGKEPDQGFEAWGVPANPDYVRYMEGKVQAQAETGIDGSYVDWTQIAGGTSYDPYTRTDFITYLTEFIPADVSEKKYGTSDYANIQLPTKRGEPFWMEWITYRCHSVAQFHDHLRSYARKYNPYFMISGNIFGGFGYGPIAYDAAGNMEMLGKVDDFIYSEIQEFLDSAPRKRDDGMKITNSPALKFLAAASHGKPVIVYATEITPPIFPNPTEKCLSAMAQINIAEAAANHAIFREKRETPPGATAIHNFLAANESSLSGAHLHSNVGILASLTQYLADEQSFAFTASRVLADRGITHTMLVEDDLLSDVHKQFDLIVLPYLPLLSVEKQTALKRYVENGGSLLVLGETGKKDQYNLPHADIPLAALFGKGYPNELTSIQVGSGKACFVPLAIPKSRFRIPTKTKGEFTTFGPTMADLFADIPEGYTRGRIDPALMQKLETVADQIITQFNGNLTRLVKPQPYLEMTTMMQKSDDRMLVHLVNYDVTVDGVITPAKNVDIQLMLPKGKQIKSLMFNGMLSELSPVEFDSKRFADRDMIIFSVDQVDVYGLAVVQLQ
ncbi:beta-galactosidase trimerization domain-containing protein [candidate division KSB1 bacterium]|nr:beta-galactosidase trimerization domain-containing protein [candidate division KSB1 bacterium]